MPPRPFPYPLRVGVDVCNVSRVRRMVMPNAQNSPARLNRFIRRVLTQPERLYFWDRFGPQHEIHARLDAASEYLAGRFAAKEAIRKACDHFHSDARGLQTILILPLSGHRNNNNSARPQGLVLDRSYDELRGPLDRDESAPYEDIDAFDGQLCEISISHDDGLATAIALVPSMQRDTCRSR